MKKIEIHITFELNKKRYLMPIKFSLRHTSVKLLEIKADEEMSSKFKVIKATTVKEWLRLKKILFFRTKHYTDIIRWAILFIMILVLIIKIYLLL